jgi:hypothetical protein
VATENHLGMQTEIAVERVHDIDEAESLRSFVLS